MDKQILYDYMDSCRLILELEAEIERLRASCDDAKKLERESAILTKQIESAEKTKRSVEEWMLTLTSRMQRIIRMHYFEGLTWDQTAARFGPYESGENLRQEFRRFINR